MSGISAAVVKQLREMTGAGMMDCKNALVEAGGDIDKATEVLRKKGLKSVQKRSGKVAAEGLIYSYIHTGGRVGVMLELNCETDFVARGEEFGELAKAIAMHIAWANPTYLSREDVPESVITAEKEIYRSQVSPEQERVGDKIVAGKLENFLAANCLLEQLDARDTSKKLTIGGMIDALSAKIGEKMTLRRYVRFEVGAGIEKAKENFADEVARAANV